MLSPVQKSRKVVLLSKDNPLIYSGLIQYLLCLRSQEAAALVWNWQEPEAGI